MTDANDRIDGGSLRELCSGIGFPEGPLWSDRYGLLVASVSRGRVCRISLDGEVEVFTEVGGTPTGLAEDRSGRLWIMQPGPSGLRSSSDIKVAVGCLQIFDPTTQEVSQVTEGVHAPNDCVLGPDGRVWFGDMVVTDESRLRTPGYVSAVDVETHTVERMADDVIYPNGIVFSPDGTLAYASSTEAGTIQRYGWDSARLDPKGAFVQLDEGEHADGLAVDREGWLYVATSAGDSIRVFDVEGRPVQTVSLPGMRPVSVCFAGNDRSTLAITAATGGRVLAAPVSVPG